MRLLEFDISEKKQKKNFDIAHINRFGTNRGHVRTDADLFLQAAWRFWQRKSSISRLTLSGPCGAFPEARPRSIIVLTTRSAR
jgi:hypothetical protein